VSNVSDKTYNDEIDLLSLIESLWDGKWKITFIVAITLISTIGFNIVRPTPIFTATTIIKPITSFEFDKYSLFNSSLKIIEKTKIKEKEEERIFNIFEITQDTLLSLYIEKIEEGSLLESGIDKFNLINKDNFDNESNYREAIQKFASEIQVLRPVQKKNKIRLHHELRAEFNDKDKWKDLLTFVDSEANKKVKASISNRFKTIVSMQNQKKDFAIKDLDIKIENVKKDYDRYTKDRLAFLNEQAAIARKLDIEKSTISSQKFSAQNTFVTNVKTDAPFYLRGYLAIEEEMRQINNRKDKNPFISDLLKLEQQKRDLAQNETIIRAIDLFNKTPLNQSDFQATIVKVATTDFKQKNRDNLYYALAIVLGSIIGVVYVLIANAFKNRKNNTVNS